MPELKIAVHSATVVPFAASPTLAFRLHVANTDPLETIYTAVLRCQIRIEVARRQYSAADQTRLRDLFGEPERWGQTLRELLWTNTSVVIPQFAGSSDVDLQVPCTFDFSVATTKYFNGLDNGDIPLRLMFSGSVFYRDAAGALTVAPISWNEEATFRLPVKIWQDMMDAYYPNSAWLCLRRDVFEDLQRFKTERGIPTWEQTFELMLESQKLQAVHA
jgi:hypothetical protein